MSKRKFAFQEKNIKKAELAEKKTTFSFIEDAVDMKFGNKFEELKKDGDLLADELVDEFKFLKQYSNRELLLAKKYNELVDSKYTEQDRQYVKNQLMSFKDVEYCLTHDDNKIELISCFQNKNLIDEWMRLRAFISILPFSSGIGRNLKYILMINDKVAGIISFASDIIAIGCRDKFIGWNKETKLQNLIYLGIGSTLVPSQPLGFLTAGGKLITLMLYSQIIADKWEKEYSRPGDPPCKLIAATTTSLFGIDSQYLGMKKYWKPLGETEGTFELMPQEKTYEKIRTWNKDISMSNLEHLEGYKKYFPHATVSSPKKRNLTYFYTYSNFIDKWKKAGFTRKDLSAMHKRGVFFARFFENSNEFLRDECDMEDLKPRSTLDFDRSSLTEIFNYWKRKWALNRFEKQLDYTDFVLELPRDMTEQKYIELNNR